MSLKVTIQHITSLILSLIGNVYCLVLVLLGLMFSLADALQSKWLQSYYTGVFLVYIYTTGTVMLLVLQLYIIPASIKKNENDNKNKYNLHFSPTGFVAANGISATLPQSPARSSDTNNNLNNNQISIIVEGDEEIDTDGPITFGENSSSSNHLRVPDRTPESRKSPKTRQASGGSKLNDSRATNSSAADNNPFMGSPHPHVHTAEHHKVEHSGSSFYLRIGLLVFGIGHMIYVIMEIDYRLIGVDKECTVGRFSWTFILRLIFLAVQTFFLFKNPTVNITKLRSFSEFSFKHLISTNIIVWLRTLISEIEEAFLHSKELHYHGNDTDHYYNDSCMEDWEIIAKVRPYLFPFVLEYCLIAVGILAILCNKIIFKKWHDHIYKQWLKAQSFIKHQSHGTMPRIHSIPSIPRHLSINRHQSLHRISSIARHLQHFAAQTSTFEEDDGTDMAETESVVSGTESEESEGFGPMHHKTHHTIVTFRSSNKGLLLGACVLCLTIVSVILFFFDLTRKDEQAAQMNFLITDMSLHLLMFIACITAIVSMRDMPMKEISFNQVDDVLLFVAMAGSFFFEIAILIPCCVYLSEHGMSGALYERNAFAVASAILSSAQSLVQTGLIEMGLRKYCATSRQQEQMKGREAITFLIVCNVTVWVFRTMQVKEIEMGIHEEFYGVLAWLLILNVSLPFLLFFYFHSSICLADIWIEAFHFEALGEQQQQHPQQQPQTAVNNNHQQQQQREDSGLAQRRRRQEDAEKAARIQSYINSGFMASSEQSEMHMDNNNTYM